jgi:aspartyl-tRNA(Asn)/glutamyl-tRNA(Gln) amidotransferase subunit C
MAGMDLEEVLRIAALARIRIAPDEARRLAGDLDRIVAYVASLADVKLPPDAETLTYFDQDVHREDRATGGLEREAALYNAPETDGVWFLVPRIVERDPDGRE